MLQPLAKEGTPPSATSHTSLGPDISIPAQRNSYEILGAQGALFVGFGSATILATLAFFVFLWYSDESNIVWKRIMLADWGVRSVTITAVLTRWVVVTQVAFATSMLAGLILQEPKVALSDSAALSLMRVNNSGPWDLTFLLSKICNRSAKLRFCGLALLLTLSTTLLQFTSTILLSDFTISSIRSESQDLLINYGRNSSNPSLYGFGHGDLLRYGNLWQSRPAAYPTFAEYVHAAPITMDGIDDSGVIIRAFFPPNIELSRSSLQSFGGLASVLGMRVVCARPQDFEFNLTVSDLTLDSGPDSGPGLNVGLSINTNKMAPELGTYGSAMQDWISNCSLPLPKTTWYFSSVWTMALCSGEYIWNVRNIPIGNHTLGVGYIVFNITGDVNSWPASIAGDRWERSTHGEWATITSLDNMSTTTPQLDISICVRSFAQQELNVFASRKTNRTEPSLSWDLHEQSFNTSAIRQQLGATSEQLSVEERGLFSLEKPENNLTLDSTVISLEDSGAFSQSWESYASTSNMSLALCQYCTWLPDIYADSAQSAIFTDILQQTSHPALALHAYSTILYSMAYYMAALQFDLQAPASITSFVLRFQPAAHRGFIIYSIIIVLHLTLIFFITCLFLSSKRQTLLSNSWQAIAQIVSAETAPILEFANRATDSEVNEWIKKKGKDEISFGIVEGEGGIRLRRCWD